MTLFVQRINAMPLWTRAPLAAGCCGLLLGLLIGWLVPGADGGGRSINLGEPWAARSVAYDSLMTAVLASPHWSRGAEPVPEPEAEPEPLDPTRPGAFQYLQLIAIQRNPALQAVFRPQKMPDAMRALMVSSPDEVGLLRVAVGSEIVSGWRVSEISDTALVIQELNGGRVIEYRLFDWQNISE